MNEILKSQWKSNRILKNKTKNTSKKLKIKFKKLT